MRFWLFMVVLIAQVACSPEIDSLDKRINLTAHSMADQLKDPTLPIMRAKKLSSASIFLNNPNSRHVVEEGRSAIFSSYIINGDRVYVDFSWIASGPQLSEATLDISGNKILLMVPEMYTNENGKIIMRSVIFDSLFLIEDSAIVKLFKEAREGNVIQPRIGVIYRDDTMSWVPVEDGGTRH